ncbi:MAG: glycosyltransferase family 4 protein [Nitrospinae bacterium]|nr:glycosyltransferase family 4 protein [Nitrospinota bacterium]
MIANDSEGPLLPPGAKPRAVILLPEKDAYLAGIYFNLLERAGFLPRLATGEDSLDGDDLTLMGFQMAAANPKLAQSIPAHRLLIDFHFKKDYEQNPTAYPFHLLDHLTVIVHDHEAERFLLKSIRAMNCKTALFPYKSQVNACAIGPGERKIFSPAEFKGHPWLAGMEVEYISPPFPPMAPAGSFIVAPEYDPAIWPTLFWGAEGGLPAVLPANESFSSWFFYGALLFDPSSQEDFNFKTSMLSRPAPAGTKPEGVKRKIGIVAPRHGRNAPGGAETLADNLARNLRTAGHDAEIITTCTDSMIKWNNHLSEGLSNDEGLPVRRFAIDKTDQTGFHSIGHKINKREPVSWTEETEWLRLSIRSRAMEAYLKAHEADYDHLFFVPYLYGTAYWPSQIAPEKSYLIPCYHREAPAYTRALRQNAMWVSGISFNTLAEKRLAETELKIRNENTEVIGLGVDTRIKGDPARFRAKTGVDYDFLLYVGRLQREKNVPQLLDYFHSGAGQIKSGLLLAGMGDVRVKDDPSIRLKSLGFVPEQEKIDAYSACLAFVLPSTQESFSIVMMESWLQGRPVIANAACNVAREHIYTCGGGLLYSDAAEFAQAVRKLEQDKAYADELGQKGREYALANFQWENIIARLDKFLNGAPPRPLWERLGEAARRSSYALSEGREGPMTHMLSEIRRNLMGGEVAYETPLLEALANVDEQSHIHPEYREFSDRPVIGPLLSKIRGLMTNHLRKNYLEILESKQTRFNSETVKIIRRLFEDIRKLGG